MRRRPELVLASQCATGKSTRTFLNETPRRKAMRPLCLCAALAALFASTAMAEDAPYPARPIQIVVPATPGGPVDTAIRMIEPRLSAALGTPLVLLNRPGASGIVGMSSVATATPDGYTIGQGVTSVFTIVRMSGSTVPYELDSFVLIGNCKRCQHCCGQSGVPLEDLRRADRLRAHQSRQAELRVGRHRHLLGARHAGHHQRLQARHDRGALRRRRAVGDRYSGAACRHRARALQHGRGDAAGQQAPRPGDDHGGALPGFPDVPTFAERGLSIKGLDLVLGLYAPKGIPDSNARVLVNALQQTMSDPAVAAKLATVGLFAQYESPAAARERLEQEYH